MLNKIKSAISADSDYINTSKYPTLVSVFLIYLSILFTNKMNLHEFAGATIIMAVQALLYLFSGTIFKHKYWIYFGIQGIIAFDYAVIAHEGYITILLGIIPLLICQSIIIYHDIVKVTITSLFFYCVFFVTILIFDGFKVFLGYIPVLLLITIVIRVFSAIFFKQVKLRIQTQKVLKELELAYERVEELTLTNERQRMARDLHDTLSQGLAGIIMQLEAVNANLNNNNINRAKEIVQKSMEHARKTLSDSRLVINDLRFQPDSGINFTEAIKSEIANFRSVSNTSVLTNIKVESQIQLKIVKHILYIVREVLNNIAKHARAKSAEIKIIEESNVININLIDDGIGFDVNLLDKLYGHYGIMGITERVKALNGEISIESKRKHGTNIHIIIPIGKGIVERNE